MASPHKYDVRTRDRLTLANNSAKFCDAIGELESKIMNDVISTYETDSEKFEKLCEYGHIINDIHYAFVEVHKLASKTFAEEDFDIFVPPSMKKE